MKTTDRREVVLAGLSRNLHLIIAPIVASLLVLFIDGSQIINILKYGMFYLLAVVPISMSAARILLPKKNLNSFQSLVLGYPITIFFIGTSFVLYKAIGWPVIMYVIPLLGIYILINNKTFNQTNEGGKGKGYSIKLLLIYGIAALLLFLTFTLTARNPYESFTSNVYEDTLWTVGNTWAALRGGLPLQDSRFSGVELSYHIAQNLYYAATSFFTGINPIDLHLKIAPYFDIFFLVSIIPVSAEVFLKKKESANVVICLPLLFASVEITKLKIGADPGLFEIYWNPISLVFGLGSFIILMVLLSQDYLKEEVPIKYICIVFAVAMCSKGILGILIPGGFLVAQLIQYFVLKRQANSGIVKICCGLALVFVFLKLSLFNGIEGHTLSPQIEISPVAVKAGSLIGLGDIVSNLYFLIGPISRFIRFIFHTLIWNWITLPAIVLCFWNKKILQAFKKNEELFVYIIGFAIASGAVYSLNIFESYWANLYLYRYTIVCTSIGLGMIIYELMARRDSSKLTMRRIDQLSLAILSVPIVIFANQQVNSIGSEGWQEERLFSQTERPLRHMNADEFKAMEWIRENIHDSKIIASDRKNKVGWSDDYVMQVWFGYSAYTGKQFYNEGADYNPHAVKRVAPERWERIQNLLKSNNREEVIGNFKEIEADYLIVTKRITKNTHHLRNNAEVIFENNGIILFKNPMRDSIHDL